MSQKCIYFIFALFVVAWLVPAQETIFIKGGEVEGIRVGSFYLSSEVISNQDYFTFIQLNGYKKLSLWDQEILNKFDTFKNEQGDYAPRTWKSGSPPIGQEFQPLLGISVYEARAYAKNIGWFIPTKSMWKLAKQVNPEIGPYPWKDEGGDNFNSIRIARYYAPAKVWEGRFEKLQKEMAHVKRSSAKISTVNFNASGIRDLERKLRTSNRDLKQLQEKVNGVNQQFTKDVLGKMNALSEKIKAIETKSGAITQKKLQAYENRIVKLEEKLGKFQNLDKEIRDIANTSISKFQKTVEARLSGVEKDMERFEKEKDEIKQQTKKLENQITQWRSSVNKIDTIDSKLRNSIERLAILDKDTKVLENQVSVVKDEQKKFREGQTSFQVQQTKKIENEVKNLKDKFDKIEKLETDIVDCAENIRQLKVICPQLPSGTTYSQLINALKDKQTKNTRDITKLADKNSNLQKSLVTLRNKNFEVSSKLEDTNNSVNDVKSDISRLKQSTGNITRDIQTLRKQDAILGKKEESAIEKINSITKINEKQDKDITQLFQQTSQTSQKTKDLDTKIQECKTVDLEQSKKNTVFELTLNNLKEKDGIHDKRIEKTNDEIKNLRLTDIEHSKKTVSINANIETLKKKIEDNQDNIRSFSTKFKNTMGAFKSETDLVRKQLYKDIQADLKKINSRVTQNNVNFVSLKQKLTSSTIQSGNSLKSIQKRVQKIEEKNFELENDLRIGATQMRTNMIEVGDKISKLFRKGFVIGPISGKDKFPKKEEKKEPKVKVKKVYEKVIEKIVVKKEVVNKVIVDKKHISELCYNLGKMYYEYAKPKLALACVQLALHFNPKHAASKKFITNYWEALNCPKDMVYVKSAKVELGSQVDAEFPVKNVKLGSFYIDKYEVTRKEFYTFVKTNGYYNKKYWTKKGWEWRDGKPRVMKKPTPDEEKLPMTNISYYEAEAYAKWAGKRLPTPEEWEYAARGKDMRVFPWGNTPAQIGKFFMTNFRQLGKVRDRYYRLAPVNAFPKDTSPFGVRGMAGNVSEWCNAYHKTPGTKKKFKVVKGGSFKHLWFRLQTFTQLGRKPGKSLQYVGFRCVKDIPVNN